MLLALLGALLTALLRGRFPARSRGMIRGLFPALSVLSPAAFRGWSEAGVHFSAPVRYLPGNLPGNLLGRRPARSRPAALGSLSQRG